MSNETRMNMKNKMTAKEAKDAVRISTEIYAYVQLTEQDGRRVKISKTEALMALNEFNEDELTTFKWAMDSSWKARTLLIN